MITEPFVPFPSIPRLSREIICTEKIDGSNAQILIQPDGTVLAGSRTRWITPEADNFGFARWVHDNTERLRTELGFGQHYGEWWGAGIQRKYGQTTKRFSLFNTTRWTSAPRTLCDVVPVLYQGEFDTAAIDKVLNELKLSGSIAAPGFMQPEGVVVFHVQSQTMFKKTLDKGDGHKGSV